MRKKMPLWIGHRPASKTAMCVVPALTLKDVRESLVRQSSRTLWQRIAHWLDQPVF